jgi:hypothetical protein
MDLASIDINTNLISTVNDIKMAIYKSSDPTAIVQSITEAGTGHGGIVHAARTWNFDHLERVMHFFKLYELDNSGNIINTLNGPIYFLPSNQTFESKNPKLIHAGTTIIPGTTSTVWPTNVNTVNIPDWIGWELESFVRPGGVGELKHDNDQPVDYLWNAATGDLTLQQPGDVFQDDEWFIAHFQNKYINASGGVSGNAGSWTTIYEITADTLLTVDDIGKKILINPSGNYLEITLPDYATVPENKITWFEMDVSFDNTNGFIQKGAVIKTHSGQIIQWLEGNLSQLEINPCESFELYKRVVSTGPDVFEWRIQNADGSWMTVGESCYSDVFSNVINGNKQINKIYALGSAISSLAYVKLYNRHVLKLDAGSVVSYAAWTSGDNQYKWSLKDPSTGNFHVPISGPFDRPNNGSQTAGLKVVDTMRKHKHAAPYNDAKGFSPPFGSAGYTNKFGAGGGNDADNDWWYTNDGSELAGATTPMNTANIFGTETAPVHRITNKYFRC